MSVVKHSSALFFTFPSIFSPVLLGLLLSGFVFGQFNPNLMLPFEETPLPGQFGLPPDPADIPFARDTVKGEWINNETPLEKPVIVFEGVSGIADHDGPYVVAINEPNNAVEIFTMGLDRIAVVPVGLGPTALAQRPGSNDIWVTCHYSAAAMVIRKNGQTGKWEVVRVVRPQIPNSATGMRDAATPAGLAFNGDGSKAFVAASTTNSFWSVDLSGATPSYAVTVISGDFLFNSFNTATNEPRALVYHPSEGRVYSASRRSGNDTAAVNFVDLGGLFSGPILIPSQFGLSAHNIDIQAIDATTDSLSTANGKTIVGGNLFGLGVSPDGDLVVTHMDARNGEFIGESSFPNGVVARNMMTIIQSGQTAPPYFNAVDLDQLADPLSFPTDIAFGDAGRIYIAAYTSDRVGVFDKNGNYLGSLSTAANPRGLAVAQVGDTLRLYVMSRGEGLVESYNITAGALPANRLHFSHFLFDPTYHRVKEGRVVFNDSGNSGSGTTSCATCHPDARADGFAWDLSKFYDEGTNANPPVFPQDRKMAMVTQDLRSLEGMPPYHWRGEQKDLEDFNGAFKNLLHGSELEEGPFALLKQYIFSIQYQPNPFQMMNRGLTTAGAAGADSFVNDPYNESGDKCIDCHAEPLSTDNSITDGFIHVNSALPSVISVVTTHFLGLHDKRSPRVDTGQVGGQTFRAPVTGFGSSHSGIVIDDREFVEAGFGFLSLQVRQNIATFQEEFDNQSAPATNYSEYFSKRTLAGSRTTRYLVPQANAKFCDIAFKGRIRDSTSAPWRSIGYFYDRRTGKFIPDRVQHAPLPPKLTPTAFAQKANQNLLEGIVLGVPLGSGERIGVDQDRDRYYDGDERAIGLKPEDPDYDDDGFWDGEDSAPMVSGSTTPTPVLAGPPEVAYITTNSVKICFETTRLSPSHILFGKTASYGRTAGDPLVLAAGSNEWKRQHTVFLRILENNTTYHFAVRTRGQNGLEWQSDDFSVTTAQDFQPGQIRVTALSASAVGSGASTTFSLSVNLADDQLAPYDNATIHLLATHLTPPPTPGQRPVPQAQAKVDTGVTSTGGAINFTWDPMGQFGLSSGDWVEFSIHMARDDTDYSQSPPTITFQETIEDFNATPNPFSFPESVLYTYRVLIP